MTIDIDQEAEEILENFSERLASIQTSEFSYAEGQTKPLRPDGQPVQSTIYKAVLQVAPDHDAKGYFLVLKERMKL